MPPTPQTKNASIAAELALVGFDEQGVPVSGAPVLTPCSGPRKQQPSCLEDEEVGITPAQASLLQPSPGLSDQPRHYVFRNGVAPSLAPFPLQSHFRCRAISEHQLGAEQLGAIVSVRLPPRGNRRDSETFVLPDGGLPDRAPGLSGAFWERYILFREISSNIQVEL